MNDRACTVAVLHLHPIPGCAPMAVNEALVIETGLELDRSWLLVSAAGEPLSHREAPQLAQVQTALRQSDLVLRAPGMLALHLSLETVEEETRVSVRQHEVKAYHMGALAAQWFADFLGQRGVRLLRLDPDKVQVDEPDDCALLPNIVLEGAPSEALPVEARSLELETAQGPVRFELFKPLMRCPVSNRDEQGRGIGLVFGFNARVASGVDRLIEVGARGTLLGAR